VQPWGLASGRPALGLFGSGHKINDYVIFLVVRLFLAEGWHCKPFLAILGGRVASQIFLELNCLSIACSGTSLHT
jgi:hypothetical protein